jgi:hypothetical protein
VFEIVARREPHTAVDPLDVGRLIRYDEIKHMYFASISSNILTSFKFRKYSLVRDQNLTPTIPGNCPPLLRKVMELCWKRQPDDRPVSFLQCLLNLTNSKTFRKDGSTIN